MSSQGHAALPAAKGRGLGGGRRAARPVRRMALVVSLAAIFLLGVASVASASNFYWYGENNSNCWQTGQPGASSSTCDGVGEWFLNTSNPVPTREGALDGDLGLTQSGDYCNAYNLNEGPFYTRDTNNEEGLTGFNPSPQDTMTDGHGSVCQALGTTWGQGLRPAAKATCGPCGMQHYVSFASQKNAKGEATLRPWSNAFAGPALVIEAAAYPQVVKAEYVWGYLCPLFEEVGSKNGKMFEYCFVEWQKGWALPNPNYILESANADGHDSISLRTDFALGTSFATEIAGSGNSYEYGSEHPWIGPFKAAIREANLLAASKAANEKFGYGFKENPSEYALIGVEQGTEENNSTPELGEKTEGLKLYTEYSALNPPTVTTEAASEIQLTQAKLNGSVDPNESDAHYDFEYGTTTSYGSSTGEVDTGSGANGVAASATVTGLQSGTTYHFRIVARNASGTPSYGADRTLTTARPEFAESTIWTSWGSSFPFTLADVNGDGKADLVGYNASTGEVVVGLSTGSSFAESKKWTSWRSSFPFTLADVNGDGKADLVGYNASTLEVVVGLSEA